MAMLVYRSPLEQLFTTSLRFGKETFLFSTLFIQAVAQLDLEKVRSSPSETGHRQNRQVDIGFF